MERVKFHESLLYQWWMKKVKKRIILQFLMIRSPLYRQRQRFSFPSHNSWCPTTAYHQPAHFAKDHFNVYPQVIQQFMTNFKTETQMQKLKQIEAKISQLTSRKFWRYSKSHKGLKHGSRKIMQPEPKVETWSTPKAINF